MLKNSDNEIVKFPLNSIQKGMLIHSLNDPHLTPYINQVIFTLPELINKSSMEKAINKLVECHDILKARVDLQSFELEIPKKTRIKFEFIDLLAAEEEQKIKRLKEILILRMEEKIRNPNSGLVCFLLIKLENSLFKLVFTYHHILLGGTAAVTVAKNIFSIYDNINGSNSLQQPLITPYINQYHLLENEKTALAENYWKQLVENYSECVEFPGNVLGVISNNEKIQRFTCRVEGSLYLNLKEFCKKEQLTPNIVFQFVLMLILSKYNNMTDVVVGLTHEMKKTRLGKLIGLQINTLPVRLKVQLEDTIKTHLLQIKDQHKALQKFGSFPLDEIQKLANLPSKQSLFALLFNFMPYSPEYQFHLNNPDCQHRSGEYICDTHYSLVCDVHGELSQFKIIFSYKNSKYDSDFISYLATKFVHLLSDVIRLTQEPIQNISLVSNEEKKMILYTWQGKKDNQYLGLTVDQLVDIQVEQTPNAIAIVDYEDNCLSFVQLKKEASKLAYNLQVHLVGNNRKVVIYMERCIERVIAQYGIMKAGAAYVPVEINTPQAMIKYILENSVPSIILTKSNFINYLNPCNQELDIPIITIDLISDFSLEANNYVSSHKADSDIYVMYTSGTTGNPKGVINVHQGLANQLLWMKNNFPLKENDVALHRTSFAFDVSFIEVFLPLISGFKLVLFPDKWQIDTFKIIEVINKYNITTLNLVPSMLKLLLQTPGIDQCLSLDKIFCIGEVLLPAHQELLFKMLKKCKLYNLYGPVEASVNVLSWTCSKEEILVPIGRPINNTQVFVLNDSLELMPPYVRGQICISGVALAKGYLNEKTLTKEKFVKNPYSIGTNNILYKTGDIGYLLPDGRIQYIGRLDNQFKVRGYRVEIEEVEHILQKHPQVKKSAVVVKKNSGSNYLLAYIVRVGLITLEDIRNFIQVYLPFYMVPDEILFLDSLPTLSNGKIDRKLLEDFKFNSVIQENSSNSVTTFVAQIWSEVLQKSKQAMHSFANFFDIGGNSLNAVQVSIRLSHHYRYQIPVQILYENQTLEKYCETIMKMVDSSLLTNIASESKSKYLLSSAQKQLWFLYKINPKNPAYNISVSLQINGNLNLSALDFSFKTLIQRHPTLRSIIKESENGEPIQEVLTQLDHPGIKIMDMQGNTINEVKIFVENQTQIPFNLKEKISFGSYLLS